MELYRSKDLMRITGETANKISFWATNGLIDPEINEEGRGGRRKFSRKNALQAVILSELNRLNVDIPSMRFVMNYLNIRQFCKKPRKGSLSFWECVEKNPTEVSKKPYFVISRGLLAYGKKRPEGVPAPKSKKLIGLSDHKEMQEIIADEIGVVILNLQKAIEVLQIV